MRFVLFAITLLAFPGGTSAANPLPRWALLASEEVAQSGLLDLLTVELTQRGSVELVEREKLQDVVGEQALSAFLAPQHTAQRMQLGQLLRANALMVLSFQQHDPHKRLRVVVCDADLGVRLWDGEFVFANDAEITTLVPHCAAVVDDVRLRFSDGVRCIIAVPPFLCEDFEQRFDHLQTRYRDRLRHALATYAGVAIVETEEARAILGELDDTLSTGLQRNIAMMLRASYSVSPADANQQRMVRFKIVVADGEGPATRIEHTLPLQDAGRWLQKDLPQRLLVSHEHDLPALSPSQQYPILARDAERFAELGNWQQAIALRETALVLDPQHAQQRTDLVGDYQHRYFADLESYWHPARFAKPLPPEPRRRALRLAADDYRVGLEHLSYLIRNRLIDRRSAITLCGQHRWYKSHAVGSSRLSDPLKFEALLPACQAQRAFLRDVYPLINQLPDGQGRSRHGDPPTASGRAAITAHVISDVRFNDYEADSLASLQHWILHAFAVDEPTVESILGLLSASTVPKAGEPAHKAWTQFLTSLRDAEHAGAQRYAAFANGVEPFRRFRLAHRLEQLLDEVQHAEPTDRAIVTSIQRVLMRLPPTALPPPTAPLPPGNLGVLGRMRLEPIRLQIEGPSTDAASPQITGMLRCGDRDVYWTKDRFFGMPQPGVLQPWELTDATADHALFWEVSWDGKYVWLHAHGQGIIVVSNDGMRVASFKGKTPPYGKGHKLLGISPGRAIMVGSFGETRRAWCGLLEVDEAGHPSVNVFLQAKRVPQTQEPERAAEAVDTAFVPNGISRVTDVEGRQHVVVQRGGMSRLMIDLETLEAKPIQHLAGFEGVSTQTDLGFSGSLFLHEGQAVRAPSGVAISRNSRQLLLHDGWLYRPGYVWMRQHVKTQKLERLQAATLPQQYWNLRVGSSAHYGLISFDPYNANQSLTRIQVLTE